MNRILTKTLAEIYLQQGHLEEAYKIFKVLAKKDPSDIEIQKRLKELDEKLNLSCPLTDRSAPSPDEKLRTLKRWLVNVRERRRK
jgi:hypothetical protein